MIINDDEDEVVFESTGRKEYFYAGIIGINSRLRTFYGYDGDFGDGLTKQERQELVDYMIGLWNKYKNVVLREET